MQKLKLGNSDLEVSAVGLGGMGMSFSYGPPAETTRPRSSWSTGREGGF
jgi:aryl-alcohol dehydrogenase-like predicted oxidoreductase